MPDSLLATLDDPSCLIYGIGNVGRQDDGLGWAFIDWLEESRLCPRARLVRGYQLVLEDADLLARVRAVLFVDSTKDPAVESFEVQRPLPHLDVSFTSHALSVPSVLATCELCFERVPDVPGARHSRVRMGAVRRPYAGGGSQPGCGNGIHLFPP